VRTAELLSLDVYVTAGMVLFLEEDHFVAEDFIHVLRLMERTCRVSCDRCNILSLGTYLKTYNYYGDSKKVGKCRLTVCLLMLIDSLSVDAIVHKVSVFQDLLLFACKQSDIQGVPGGMDKTSGECSLC